MADTRFDGAVILAGMRTGSNLLEESLGSFPGVRTHGEVFNPHFFGQPGRTRLYDLDLAAREADPLRVLSAMTAAGGGFPVFRLFQDHDPRVLAHVLADPRMAKIVLTRPALDAWVSLKIARRTGQWWLGDGRKAKSARVTFVGAEFDDFAAERAAYYRDLRRALQDSGQTSFDLDYDDLFSDEVIEGLGRWLGLVGPRDRDKVVARVQNPAPLSERLSNPEEAARHLGRVAAPDLSALRDYEPERGPGLRGFVASRGLPILYMPIRGAVRDPVAEWLGALPGAGEVTDGMTQKDLRRWWRAHPGHRSFTILRHPLARAWDAFATHVMAEGGMTDLRALLVERYGLALPEGGWSAETARAGFTVFLGFVEANLKGQTSVRVDASWTSQGRLLSAISGFATPDVVMREDTLAADIVAFCDRLGILPGPAPRFPQVGPVSLNAVVTPDIEALSAQAYRRDMLTFGFGPYAA